MTTRAGKPDTDADIELRNSLDGEVPASFVMVAGAGSGKTTSLVKALDHLARTKGASLRRRGQQIACITYTEIAVGEIWADVGNASLFHVSTIHSFLWKIVQPFQVDLKQWVLGRIEEKIAAAQERIEKPGTREATRQTLTLDIERYQAQTQAVGRVTRFTYGTGSDYAKGILGHDDILKVGPALITDRPLLRTLVANRFPIIFVDESQDTNPAVVEALRLIAADENSACILGFFGDPMQKIYTTGAGPIALEAGWNSITKPENFRCPLSVLGVINRIRDDDDKLVQTRGRMVEVDGVQDLVPGTARMFVLPAGETRSQRLADVRSWVAEQNNDPLWVNGHADADVRLLVLVHRMAALRLGFPNIYAALNDHGSHALKDGLLDGTAWVLRSFLTYILPLVLSARQNEQFNIVAALRANCPLLSPERLAGIAPAPLLARLAADVEALRLLLEPTSEATIRDVCIFVRDRELGALDERFTARLLEAVPENGVEETDQETAARAFLDCAATELWGYRDYIEDKSPFATQQGIKGAEFQRVLVVLDDEESDYNLFSYGKYFGLTALSATDQQNIAEGKDSVVSRTRRLFYVCCSRAVRDLVVVLFVQDPDAAIATISAKGIFPTDDIHGIASLTVAA